MADSKLTPDEIELEIDKVEGFFKQVPDELKSNTAFRLIYEIINWGSYNHFEALGILEEVKLDYRENSIRIMNEEAEDGETE